MCRARKCFCCSFAALVVLLSCGALFEFRAEPPANAKQRPANRLARETSPYLLLHAHNPVDWYPWGPEAFEKARKENKLIFLSIGYSSCYWCHVMERQSFQNEDIAKVMNEKFVCVKVDREERPDVDNIYMTALHVQGARGGWPLSMFLTPDGKPIGGGTYWPPEDRIDEGGERRHGFKSILKLVSTDWEKDAAKLQKHADDMASAVNTSLGAAGRRAIGLKLQKDLVTDAVLALKDEHDPTHGGFGSKQRLFRGPKFPQPALPELLLTFHEQTKDEEALKIVTVTLDRMARGGIYDHLGGGFHRYSVDREWKVPHFEKMLYDNAQLVSLYSHAYRVTRNPEYRRVVEETIAFVLRELTSPQGGFYSALDAETHGEEGKYYVWTGQEIDEVLGKEEAGLFKKIYGVDAGPNFEDKYSVLLLPRPMAELAAGVQMDEAQLRARLEPSRQKLLASRAKRERPLLDTKVLTSWNGLMIAGLADAGVAFQKPEYIQAAERAAAFLLKNLRGANGRLLRTYSATADGKGEAKLNAYVEDYAALIHGLLNLHEATGKATWLQEARTLAEAMVEHYHDKAGGGFYFTAHDHEKLFARAKDQHDGATPSGNSLAALVLVRLSQKTGDPQLAKLAEGTFHAFGETLTTSPENLSTMVLALNLWLGGKEARPAPASPFRADNDPLKVEDPVKVSGVVTKQTPEKDGSVQQSIAITLEIAKGWHTYANPAGIDSLIPVTVAVAGASKVEGFAVSYPAGKPHREEGIKETMYLYDGKTTIPVTLRRPLVDGKPDLRPLEFSVRFQACNDMKCLPPKTVKLMVESK